MTVEEETKPKIIPTGEYNQDRELDDGDFYPRFRTPVLDVSTCYNRGHSSEIGLTSTGNFLGDFPQRGNYFIYVNDSSAVDIVRLY